MTRPLAARADETYVRASEEELGSASRSGILANDEATGIVADLDLDALLGRELVAAGTRLLSAGGR